VLAVEQPVRDWLGLARADVDGLVMTGRRHLRPDRPQGPRPQGLTEPQAVRVWLAASRPSSATDVSRILNFCTLPVTVIGKSWEKRTYLGTL
jgi:hypothetical protein